MQSFSEAFVVLGWQEVVLIFAILLFVFVPTKLPKIARELGKAMREFNRAASDFKKEINKASSGSTKAVRPSLAGASRSPLRAAYKLKRDEALSDIAEKLNLTTEGKTNEQITKEIIEKIESKKEKASNNKAVKR
jgi:sec-independent protein translocase protein TatA